MPVSGFLRELFGGAQCEKRLTINTISVTTPMARDPGGCVLVQHRGATNRELAATAAEFIARQAASGVVFLYDRPDPYAADLVAETQNYLKTRHEWTDAGIFDINDLKDGAPSSHSMTSVLFAKGEYVDVRGVTKGRGFAGVVKRHGFVAGHASHGPTFGKQPGSIGSSAYPSRVIKGKRLPGRMGGVYLTIKNLEVVGVDSEQNYVLVRGAIPGPPNGLVYIQKREG